MWRKSKIWRRVGSIAEELLEVEVVWHSLLLLQQDLRKSTEAAKFLHRV